jgi:DNA-binding response OmpR family regulator
LLLRFHHPDDPGNDTPPDRSRLNLLLSYGGWRDDCTVDHLARLLEPMGIRSHRVHTGEEAHELIRNVPVHIAVVDLAIPLQQSVAGRSPGGARILQLLKGLATPPPTVVVRPPQPQARESARTLTAALREGAFAVLDRPIQLETMLETMRRILRRHYADIWPAT